MISPQRRNEIVDALRRGTVPRRSLDAFAVGLEAFETVVGEELASVAAGSARAHSRFPGHALTPTGVMAIRCKQFHLPDL